MRSPDPRDSRIQSALPFSLYRVGDYVQLLFPKGTLLGVLFCDGAIIHGLNRERGTATLRGQSGVSRECFWYEFTLPPLEALSRCGDTSHPSTP